MSLPTAPLSSRLWSEPRASANGHDQNIVVEADYVILRGLDLRGVQHVVIEDCHTTGWGRIGGAPSWGVTSGTDSAIHTMTGTPH